MLKGGFYDFGMNLLEIPKYPKRLFLQFPELQILVISGFRIINRQH